MKEENKKLKQELLAEIADRKICVLDGVSPCNHCGECLMCDLDPDKVCDNCGKCIGLDGNLDYRAIRVDGIVSEDMDLDEYID